MYALLASITNCEPVDVRSCAKLTATEMVATKTADRSAFTASNLRRIKREFHDCWREQTIYHLIQAFWNGSRMTERLSQQELKNCPLNLDCCAPRIVQVCNEIGLFWGVAQWVRCCAGSWVHGIWTGSHGFVADDGGQQRWRARGGEVRDRWIDVYKSIRVKTELFLRSFYTNIRAGFSGKRAILG